MGRAGYCYREVVPFTFMVIAECTNVGLSTIFKAATNEGLSYLVFMFYSYVISTLFLLPIAFLFHRKTELPRFITSLALRMMLLGALGFTAQLAAYKGIEYASPTLCSAMNNLTPASTFVLAIIFSLGAPRLNLLRATQNSQRFREYYSIVNRTEKLALRSISSVAKIIGTMVSITGALVVVLYKGPQIFRFNHLSSVTTSLYSQFNSPTSTQSNWLIGGALLAANSLIISIWYIFQAKTLKEYPAELLVVFFYHLSCTIISTPLCLLAQPNSSAWKIKPNIRLVAILYGGIIGSLDTTVHAWALHVKGPVYVALFKPLSIAVAAIMGVIFLGDSLYLGSIVGAVIISFGFYFVMWGKVQEEVDEVDHVEVCNTESSSKEHVPLLKRLH